MKIAIIGGSGKMGQWFARFLKNEGHDVLIIGRDGERLKVVQHDLWGRYRYGLRLVGLNDRFLSDFKGLMGQLAREFPLRNLFPSS